MERTQKDLREIIIKSAQDIFARFGFRKTTMDEIAQSINKAKSSLYHYFTSKQEIFKAIIEKEASLFREEITRTVSRENTPQGKLHVYILTRMRMINQLANLYSALKDEYLKQYDYIEELREKYDKEEIEVIKEILKEGCKRGVYEIENLDRAASTIVSILKGMEYSWIKEKDVKKAERYIDNLLEILFYGIVKR
ncbi:MAG: TetR/AcrR family transcriptional regulator [candidate division WOR-3 bacterium]